VENKRSIGCLMEEKAEAYIKEHGGKVIARNYFFKGGELDVIAWDKEYLCFIEVKYRADNRLGFPEEAVTRQKQQKIIRGARSYMYQHKIPFDTPCRFDVISILGEDTVWIKDAFCE